MIDLLVDTKLSMFMLEEYFYVKICRTRENKRGQGLLSIFFLPVLLSFTLKPSSSWRRSSFFLLGLRHFLSKIPASFRWFRFPLLHPRQPYQSVPPSRSFHLHLRGNEHRVLLEEEVKAMNSKRRWEWHRMGGEVCDSLWEHTFYPQEHLPFSLEKNPFSLFFSRFSLGISYRVSLSSANQTWNPAVSLFLFSLFQISFLFAKKVSSPVSLSSFLLFLKSWCRFFTLLGDRRLINLNQEQLTSLWRWFRKRKEFVQEIRLKNPALQALPFSVSWLLEDQNSGRKRM